VPLEAAAAAPAARPRPRYQLPLIGAIAWRNLWRNPRRTWLTSGGVAFALFLMVVSRSLQVGAFDTMIENTTAMLTGHAQLQHADYFDDPALRHTVTDASVVARGIARRSDVLAIAPRAVAFALVSVGEKSFGAQVMGVDPAAERELSTIPGAVREGHYLEGSDDVVIGSVLARNLGARLGDELVVLGSTRDGAIAAMAGNIVGIVETGIADLDRALLQVPLPVFQAAFELGDEAHMIVVRMRRLSAVDDLTATPVDDPLVWRSWQALMPEVEQAIDMKQQGSFIMFGIVALLITFSVFNTFAMVVYERVREFGMLMALGMRPGKLLGMLELEAIWLALIGVAMGGALSVALVALLAAVGIPVPDDLGAVLQQLSMPDRIHPTLALSVLAGGSALMLAAVPVAGLVAMLRILRLSPVTALRAPT
jgi:ABC-type lipoprotein release transport system permease subunit